MDGHDSAARFCASYEGKVSSRCCGPGAGEAAPRRCFAEHVAKAAREDVTAACLYAVYWGVRTGRVAGEDDIGVAQRALDRLGSADREALHSRRDASDCSCSLDNLGLEVYKAAVSADKPCALYSGDGVPRVVCLAGVSPRTHPQIFVVQDVEVKVSWSAPCVAAARPPTRGYLRARFSVGNRVRFSKGRAGPRVSNLDVHVYLCEAHDYRWIEYVDRDDRLRRYAVSQHESLLMPRGHDSDRLLPYLFMDTMYQAHGGKGVSQAASRAALMCGKLAAAANKRDDLVPVIMPSIADADALAAGHDAIVGMALSQLRAADGAPGV